jgi:glutamate dehydrogenase
VTLEEDILASPLPDDPDFVPDLVRYFPPQLRDRCADGIRAHPLRREITATALVNGMVNRAGTTFAFRLGEETGASAPEILRAHEAARAIFDQDSLWREIEALDDRIDIDVQTDMYLEGRKLVERASRWLLRNRRRPLPVAATVQAFAVPVARLMQVLPEQSCGSERERMEQARAALLARGAPEGLARRVASIDLLPSALDVATLAAAYHADVDHVGSLYCIVGDRMQFDWLADRIAELPRVDRWEALARGALREDAGRAHRDVVNSILRASDPGFDPPTAFDVWAGSQPGAIARVRHIIEDIRFHGVYDLANLSVAVRELRALAAS